MKKYKTLKTIFHQFDEATAEAEMTNRRSGGFETDFWIGNYKLFYVSTPQLLLLQEQILLNERTLDALAFDIPAVARRGYLYDLITKEITATNEIEGVRSTRQEILDALEAEPHENKRFREIARLYLQLSQGALEAPDTVEELRATYDQLVGDEIKSEDLPDGELFRAGPVWIRDGANKKIHAGAANEAEIFSQLEAMFEHLSSDDVSFTLSRVISHFMLEAIHPFYDGNGRFGRFLLSVQLQEALSAYTVLTLSYMINHRKDKYYKAFAEVEVPLNRGDATTFAHAMLELIRDAQLYLIDDFTGKKELMLTLNQRIESLAANPGQLSKGAISSLFVFGQAHLFGSGTGLNWDTLSEVLGKSRSTTRKHIEELETAQLLKRVSSRPLRLVLSKEGRTLLFLSYPDL